MLVRVKGGRYSLSMSHATESAPLDDATLPDASLTDQQIADWMGISTFYDGNIAIVRRMIRMGTLTSEMIRKGIYPSQAEEDSP